MSFDTTPTPGFSASDPHARFVATSCLDLLLIELVPMAERMVQELELGVSSNSNTSTSTPTSASSPPDLDGRYKEGKDGKEGREKEKEKEKEKDKDGSSMVVMDDEEMREAVFFRLEALGYRVGMGLAERFSRDRPRFTDNLDVIKFLCKDLWTILFKKQVDNLKTNHRGVYVLSDSAFRPFSRMSMTVRSEAVARAQMHLWFPCGIIRGTLANLGINATVQAETAELPAATFQIKTIPAKS